MSEHKKPEHKKEDSKLQNLENQAAQNLAGWQKALADYQNLQKEMDRKMADLSDFVSAAYILELLPIFDNYLKALDHIPAGQKKEQWSIGLEHILKMWESFLSDHSVEKIKTVGEKFDPSIHESVGQKEDKSKADQLILEEKQSGYKLKSRVIRPAKVIINNIK